MEKVVLRRLVDQTLSRRVGWMGVRIWDEGKSMPVGIASLPVAIL